MTAYGDFQRESYLAGRGGTAPRPPMAHNRITVVDGYATIAGLTPKALRLAGARLG